MRPAARVRPAAAAFRLTPRWDDRVATAALLILPCMAMALSLGVSQTVRRAAHPLPNLFGQSIVDAGAPAAEHAIPSSARRDGLERDADPSRSVTSAGPDVGRPTALASATQGPPPPSREPAPAAATSSVVCTPEAAPRFSAAALDPRPGGFGERLAAAALAQTHDLVIYTAKYRRIGFPMGDLSPFYGACTDLVIRAYRALGVDLQQIVQKSRLGSGDTSVDHRRTEVLRRLFSREGQSLPVSEFPEDYLPGDIVTYERPFSRVSRSHIAIVADVLAPTGRPMIIHNRGWGPQLEDALFVDRITGHYRFMGLRPGVPVAVAGQDGREPVQTELAAGPSASPIKASLDTFRVTLARRKAPSRQTPTAQATAAAKSPAFNSVNP